MKCPRRNCQNLAIISRSYGVLPCEDCQKKDEKYKLSKKYEFATISRRDRVQRQRDHHGKDLLQPYNGNKVNEEFFRAYPNKVKDYKVGKELAKL